MIDIPDAAPSRLSDDERGAVTDAIARVVSNGPWIGGPEVDLFETEFARYIGASDVVGVASGTDALVLAFTALDLPPGAKVLVATNEGGYGGAALRIAGLEPVLMDIEQESMAPGIDEAERAMVPGVAAIVVTHLHGEATDIRGLDGWRQRHNLLLVEDCAQAHGARRDGVHVGLTGDAATFSFYPTKNLGAIGDAGAVAFANSLPASHVRSLRQYGWQERFRIEFARGRNSRLDALQAAVLHARLPFLDARNERRRGIWRRYSESLYGSDARLHGSAANTVAHHAVAVTPRRDALARHLSSRGICTSVHYPYLLSEMPGLRLAPAVATPVADRLRGEILSVPCFPELTDDEVDCVVAALESWRDA